MLHTRVRRGSMLWVLLFCLSAAALTADQAITRSGSGYVISGRVVDPLGLQPDDAVLMVGNQADGGFSSMPIRIQADGSFVSRELEPATYVLYVVRTPHSATHAATVVGLTVVPVTAGDVTGVTVTVQRDTALQGAFRMESDDPAAAWPTHIAATAYLVLDGTRLLHSTMAEGAPGGRFVLRNALGPRVVRTGYALAAGSFWWPAQVLLNGRDITNIPSDFSTHDDGALEVVFTRHPARFAGTVVDREGQPAPRTWVLVVAADSALWQPWATTSHAVRADAKGGFRFPSLPGRYLARALPPETFASERAALQQIAKFAPGAAPVELGARELKTLTLTVEHSRSGH